MFYQLFSSHFLALFLTLFTNHVLANSPNSADNNNILIQTSNDNFISILDPKSGKTCQGFVINNKIITSAKCFCDYEAKLFIKTKAKIKITTNSSTQNFDKIIDVEVYKHDLACRIAQRNSYDSELLYDKNFFDIAILNIISGSRDISLNNKYPVINCTYPNKDQFTLNGTMALIGRQSETDLYLAGNRFSLMPKPNGWHENLELFSSGFRKTTQDDFFGLNENQDGTSLVTLSADLLVEANKTNSDFIRDVAKAIKTNQIEKLNIIGISTRGLKEEKPDDVVGRGNNILPFFNVKKFLQKHIPHQYLNADCLNDVSPSGFFGARVEIY